MGTVIFWICFLILILLLCISGIHQASTKKAARKQRIRDIYESDFTVCHSYGRFDEGTSLLEHLKKERPDDFILDDPTVSDLALKEIYARMNRCLTNAGEDYLYCRFRMMYRDPKMSEDMYSRICSYDRSTDEIYPILNALDKCRKRQDADAFAQIDSLSDARVCGYLRDIIPLIGLVASLFIIPFEPPVGIGAFIIMILVCIGTYFGGKSEMDENLRGLALTLRYIDCAKELVLLGIKEFEGYDGLFGLSRASFLIPYKDGTSSNPLSMIYDYVRMITHIDLIAYKIRIAGIKNHHDRILGLYTDIGSLDACIAVASYLKHRDHCGVCFTDKSSLSAIKLYHPLVSEPVCNDMITDKGVVITGSNASGKSTFLKAVGISTLFAASFGFAFAKKYETGRFDLYTSMALTDDLLGGDSYYVVEARSLKRICDAAKKGNVLCIIDEVLRGTNTVERIAASARILGSLARPSVLCFAATHDLELPGLLSPDMDSYYFTEEINDGNVTFPYVINKGTTEKTNAIRLLLELGYDDEIVDSATDLVRKYKKTGRWVDVQ